MPISEEPVMKAQQVSYKRSLAIGMLLGDASSRKRNKVGGVLSVEFAFAHAPSQKDLLEWKAAELARCFGVKARIWDVYCGEYLQSRFSISQRKRLRVIHDWFHRGNRKVVSNKIRFLDHPIGLAMLLCDDGSVRRRKKKHVDGATYYLAPAITIATHCFSEAEVKLLLQRIEQLCGAKGYINPERRVRRGELVTYYRSNFNAADSKLLWDYVSAWIPRVPSMMKKFAFIIERYGLNETADT